MKKSTISAFDFINGFEKSILNTKQISVLSLESDLQQLRDFRKDTYMEILKTTDLENSDLSLMFGEYDKYCDFILELLTTKHIPKTSQTKILTNFLSEYDFIKTFDNQRIAYNSTLNSLEYLTSHPNFAGENSETNNLKTIYSLINEFIHNQNTEPEPIQE